MSICLKHCYDILLDTNLKLWVSVINMGTTYYWIPASNHENLSQTWVWHTTGYQPQTMSICHKHGYDILLDTNFKPECLSQTLAWHTTGYQPQTVSIHNKHEYNIQLDTNLKLWVSVKNIGMRYYWIPNSNCEYLSQTWVQYTTGHQPQTMSMCDKHGYNILLDTNLKPWVSVTNMGMTYNWIPTSNHEYLLQTWVWYTTGYLYLKPWVSVTNMGMTYCWIPTSNHKYLSQTWVWHNSGYLAQTVSICHKHGYDILLDTNLKPWVSVTNIGTIYYWMPTSDCKYLSQT